MTKRINENQIVKILDEAKAGAMTIEELCRKHDIAQPIYYSWKAKFGGMTTTEAQRLKALEAENAKLKRVIAEQALDINCHEGCALKKVVSPQAKKAYLEV